MVLDAVSNFVRGSTDAAVGTSDTTVSVVDASIFPDPATDGEFNVVIWDANNFPRPDQDVDVEVMRVTARDTTADELTVVRAQEATSAAAHPAGSAVHLSPTAKMFGDIEDTFADFWDSGTQELTADVNNESLSTDRINTTPTGARVNISGTQTIAHNTLTTINWGEESVRGDIGPVLNDGAIIIPDGFNWAKFTFFFYVSGTQDEMDLELAQIIRGGGSFDGFAGHRTSASPTTRELVVGPTAWTPVTSGDEFRARVRHQTGDSRDIGDEAWMEVTLL